RSSASARKRSSGSDGCRASSAALIHRFGSNPPAPNSDASTTTISARPTRRAVSLGCAPWPPPRRLGCLEGTRRRRLWNLETGRRCLSTRCLDEVLPPVFRLPSLSLVTEVNRHDGGASSSGKRLGWIPYSMKLHVFKYLYILRRSYAPLSSEKYSSADCWKAHSNV